MMIQAAFRSNFVLLGLPIAAELLPGGNLGVTALIIAIVVPFYNMMSVVVLEYFRGGKPKLGEVLLAVAKNPPYHRLGAGSADAGAAYRLAGGAGVLCRKDEQRGHAADPAAVGRVL